MKKLLLPQIIPAINISEKIPQVLNFILT